MVQAPVLAQHGPEEVIKDGVGSWCNNPSDEGLAVLSIEKISTAEGLLADGFGSWQPNNIGRQVLGGTCWNHVANDALKHTRNRDHHQKQEPQGRCLFPEAGEAPPKQIVSSKRAVSAYPDRGAAPVELRGT
eukprot:Skav207604  [mRNA]  locus=scaffold2450:221785:225502:+ [translate_table: standard]